CRGRAQLDNRPRDDHRSHARQHDQGDPASGSPGRKSHGAFAPVPVRAPRLGGHRASGRVLVMVHTSYSFLLSGVWLSMCLSACSSTMTTTRSRAGSPRPTPLASASTTARALCNKAVFVAPLPDHSLAPTASL